MIKVRFIESWAFTCVEREEEVKPLDAHSMPKEPSTEILHRLQPLLPKKKDKKGSKQDSKRIQNRSINTFLRHSRVKQVNCFCFLFIFSLLFLNSFEHV